LELEAVGGEVKEELEEFGGFWFDEALTDGGAEALLWS